jgi:hypothetical protein
MRGRVARSSLIGLGAFLIVAALVVRLVVAPSLVKLPLDQTASPAAEGSDMSFFDLAGLAQHRGEIGSVAQEVKGEPDADEAGDEVAVWHFESAVRNSDDNPINVAKYTVCIDRRTALSVAECEAANIDGDSGRKIEGLTLTFPFHTEKKDYDLFNLSAGGSFPARFVEEQELEGLTVYRFAQEIPETVVRTAQVPGPLAGAPDKPGVEADFVYSNVRTLWVEPTSGVIVKAEERPNTFVRGPDGTRGVTWLAATFTADEKTLSDGVERADSTRTKILWLETIAPLVLLGLGVVLLIVGLLLARRRRTEPLHTAVDEQPAQAAGVR